MYDFGYGLGPISIAVKGTLPATAWRYGVIRIFP